MKTHETFPNHAPVNKAVNPDRIDPFVDWGFKYLFGREQHKDLLLGFLNHLLKPEIRICDLHYINTELTPDAPDIKHCVVDVLATDEDDNRYLIEMQNVYDPDIRKRLVYYACRLVDQMSERNAKWHYGQIKKVFAICLMNFRFEREDPVLRCDYQLRSPDGRRLFSDILTVIPLQIPCIRATSPSEYRKSYEFWLYLLKSLSERMKTKDELMAEIDSLSRFPEETKEIFRKLVNTAEDTLSGEELQLYRHRREVLIRAMAEHRGAKELGIEEGLAKGRKEAFVETAKALKAEGIDLAVISKCTGLSLDEIRKL